MILAIISTTNVMVEFHTGYDVDENDYTHERKDLPLIVGARTARPQNPRQRRFFICGRPLAAPT